MAGSGVDGVPKASEKTEPLNLTMLQGEALLSLTTGSPEKLRLSLRVVFKK